MSQITKAQWEAKGRELFGSEMEKWVFICPNCGNEESVEKVRTEHAADLPLLRERNYLLEQECIGRHLPGAGCNWAAYGFFRGPVIVLDGETPDTKRPGIAMFDFSGKPFTRKVT